MKGRLSEHPLAELIRETSDAGLSGAFHLAREQVKALVYFRRGHIVLAATNLRSHRLQILLARWGEVSPERLYAVGGENASDEQIARALVSSGALTKEKLEKMRERQSGEALRAPMLWTEGEWIFNPNARAKANEGGHAPINLDSALLEAARRLPEELVSVKLREAGQRFSRAENFSDDLALTPEEAFIMSRMDAPASISELTLVTGLGDVALKRALYALHLSGVVRMEGGYPRALSADYVASALAKQSEEAEVETPAQAMKARATETAKEDANAPLDVEAFIKQAQSATHYETLAVTRSASPEDIKRSYYALAKRFHPDLFKREADANLQARIEEAFSRIARAYEVLKNTNTRAAYDLKLLQQKSQRGPSQTQPTQRQPAQDKRTETGERRNGSSAEPREQAESSYLEGVAALGRGEFEEAVRLLSHSASLQPGVARYRAFYGRALMHNRRTRRMAEAELQAAVSLEPRNADYRVMLAEMYHEVGLRNRALSELEQALSLSPMHAAARRLRKNI